MTTTNGNIGGAMVMQVRRRTNGKFNTAANWSPITIPGASMTTNDSLYGDTSVGVAMFPAVDGVSDSIVTDYAYTPILRQ